MLATSHDQSLYESIHAFDRITRYRPLHLLVSMASSQAAGEAAYYNLANVADRHLGVRLEFLGVASFDDRVEQASRSGRAAVEMFPHAPGSLQWRKHAQQIMQWPIPRDAVEGMDRFVQRLVMGSRKQLGAATPSMA